MWDFISEIQKIDKEIEQATGEMKENIIDSLQVIKTQLEREMQRALLKTEVSFKTGNIIRNQKSLLKGNTEPFTHVSINLVKQVNQLDKSFESKTGNAIKKKLNKDINEIHNDILSVQYDLADSCEKK